MPTFYSRTTGETWTLTESDFSPPKDAPEGFAEFASVELEYRGQSVSVEFYEDGAVVDAGPDFPHLQVIGSSDDLGLQGHYGKDFNHAVKSLVFPIHSHEE